MLMLVRLKTNFHLHNVAHPSLLSILYAFTLYYLMVFGGMGEFNNNDKKINLIHEEVVNLTATV